MLSKTRAQRCGLIWALNGCMALTIGMLFGLSFILPDDMALLPGIPMLCLIVLLPLGVIYGLITLVGVMRGPERQRSARQSRHQISSSPVKTAGS